MGISVVAQYFKIWIPLKSVLQSINYPVLKKGNFLNPSLIKMYYVSKRRFRKVVALFVPLVHAKCCSKCAYSLCNLFKPKSELIFRDILEFAIVNPVLETPRYLYLVLDQGSQKCDHDLAGWHIALQVLSATAFRR